MKSPLRTLLFVAAITLVGCETVQPLPTASGRPEVTISAPVAAIKNEIINRVAAKGWSIERQSENTLVVANQDTSFAATLLLGTQFGGSPYARQTFTFIELGKSSTRVFVTAEYVSNYGTAFERRMPMTDGPAGAKILDGLLRVKAEVESRKKR